MKVSELIDLLQECDGDAQVLIATQPSYPLEHSVRGVTHSSDLGDVPDDPCISHGRYGCDDCIGEYQRQLFGEHGKVWIVQGGNSDYSMGEIFDAVRRF